jgi:phospholipid transport system substrate-binding protein
MALILAVTVQSPVRAAESPASRVIAQLDAVLLGAMRDADQLGFQGRIDRIGPAVDAAFDLPFMAEKSLGPHWAALSDSDKTRWVDLSRQFTIANFSANFDHWSNQTIDLVSEEPGAADTIMVKTKINDPQGASR